MEYLRQARQLKSTDARAAADPGVSLEPQADMQRSAYRHHADAGFKSGAIGFRCIKDKE